MYHEYYGFAKKPFSISPDPDFIYLNSYYREALSMLRYGIEERKGVVCLIGEVGTGKTMLLNKLLLSIQKEVVVPSLFFPENGFEALVGDLIEQLGVSVTSGHPTGKLQALQRHLLKERKRGRIVVLLVDEAQTLGVKALEGLRHLSNIETPKEKLIQIVLSGQPELKDKLNLKQLRQFKQRIASSFELGPLPPEEVTLYIAHRMKVAGNTQVLRLFSEPALSLVASYSGGVPRLINGLCENALLIGYGLEKRQIDAPVIREAAKDLMLSEPFSSGMAFEYEIPSEEEKVSPLSATYLSHSKPERRRGPGRLLKWATVCLVALAVFVILKVWFPRQSSEISTHITQFFTEKFTGVKAHLRTNAREVPKYPVAGAPQRERPIAEPLAMAKNRFSTPDNDNGFARNVASDLKDAEVVKKDTVIGTRIEEKEAVALREPKKVFYTNFPSDISVPETSSFQNEPFLLASASNPNIDFHEIDLPGTRLFNMERNEVSPTVRTIRPGEMISSVAIEIYGFLNSYVYGMIHLANPDIENLDFILSGQTVFFPPLVLDSRILANKDGEYAVFVNACQDDKLALKWKENLMEEVNRHVDIATTWITLNVKIHLLKIEGYRNRGEALHHLKTLVSNPALADVFEERSMPKSEVITEYKGHPLAQFIR